MILASIFRNSESYLDRWRQQVEDLAERVPVRVIVAEGDSTDETYKGLLTIAEESPVAITVLKVEHGGPMFPSTDNPIRWRQIAAVCNVVLTAAVRELDTDEELIYVESDLKWTPEVMEKLLHHVHVYPAVSPMSMYHERFYDLFGYRMNGQQFQPYAPHFPSWSPAMMHKIDSSGSCMAFSNTAAHVAEFGVKDAILGVGRSLYAAGLSLWLDPTLEVVHP